MDYLLCPFCESPMVEYVGIVRCEDDEDLKIFCDDWRCKACGRFFTGNVVSDDDDDAPDGWYDDPED